MKRTRKSLAVLLALALMLSVFAACGNTEAAVSSNTSAASAASEASANEAAPAEAAETPAEEAAAAPASAAEEADTEEALAEEAAVSGGTTASGADYDESGYVLPLFDEPVTLTAWASFSDSDIGLFGSDGYKINHAYQAAEEETGVVIEWNINTNDVDKFGLAVASGDLDDIVFSGSNLYSGTLTDAIEQEVFIDIAPYMEEDMPFYSAILAAADDNTKRTVYTSEGYVPGVIGLSDYNEACKAGMLIRADYLDAVEMEEPVTYDDLHDVLTAFKSELDIAQPLMLSANLVYSSDALCAGYDVYGCFSVSGMSMAPWYQVDGEVKFGIAEDGYKDYLDMIHTWYEEGLISPDFIEKNANPMSQDYVGVITSGDAGMFFGENDLMTMYMEGTTTNDAFALECLPEIVKEEGQVTHFVNNASQVGDAFTCVTTACENVDAALTYLDFYFTDEGALLSELGVEGDAYEVVDGELQYLDSYLNNADYSDKEKNCIFRLAAVPAKGMDTPSTYTLDIQKTAEEIWTQNDDGAYLLPEVSLTVDESETYNRIYSDVSTYMAEHLTKFVTGDEDMSTWDTFIDSLYDMGLQDIIDIYQNALDRFYAIEVE